MTAFTSENGVKGRDLLWFQNLLSPPLTHLHLLSSHSLMPHPHFNCFGGTNASALETCPVPGAGAAGAGPWEASGVVHGQLASVETSDKTSGGKELPEQLV